MKNSIYTGLCWLWLTLLVFMVDLGSKQLIINNIPLHESIPVMPYVNFYYVQNTGAAFSWLADQGGWQRWLFAIVAMVMCMILICLMYQSSSKKMLNIAYALMISGALGNLFDRLVHGFVIDFIDFYVCNWHWPTFNIADISISIGAALMITSS